MSTREQFLALTVDELSSAFRSNHPNPYLAEDHLTDARIILDRVEAASDMVNRLRHNGYEQHAALIEQDVDEMKIHADERERRDAQYN